MISSRMLSPRRLMLTLALAGAMAGGAAQAQTVCPAVPPLPTLPAEAIPAPVPVPYWNQRMQELDRIVSSTDLARIKLLFLGDSITQGWDPQVFQRYYGQRAALNMGVASDTTQGLLWRLGRSPLGQQLKPQLVVLMIGTNNAHNPNTAEVAFGIAETIRLIRQRVPESKILLIGILPRGATTQDWFRTPVAKINGVIASCADQQHVFFVDPGASLLDSDGNLSERLAADRLHLTAAGYSILAAAIEPTVRALLGR
jgi:lysophospholipase L1-like esterase